MRNRLGIIILILICVGLSIGLIWSQKHADDQRAADAERIAGYTDRVTDVEANLHDLREVNAILEKERVEKEVQLQQLTNLNAQVSQDLKKVQATLKNTEEEMTKQVAQRDARIAELQNENQALDEQAVGLSTSITNLTRLIEDTRQKLAASEGDKAFLERELQRLMAEKAELERQFNDLEILRTQVARLKDEMRISRRLDWIRKGLTGHTERKGAEQLMRMSAASARAGSETPPAPKPTYDLNIEISSDGSVRVIPPLTNAPSARSQAP